MMVNESPGCTLRAPGTCTLYVHLNPPETGAIVGLGFTSVPGASTMPARAVVPASASPARAARAGKNLPIRIIRVSSLLEGSGKGSPRGQPGLLAPGGAPRGR